MLYLGIDQHKRQLTVSSRVEDGSVILKRQVNTQWEKVRVFLADLAEKARSEGERLEPGHADLLDTAHKLSRCLASD